MVQSVRASIQCVAVALWLPRFDSSGSAVARPLGARVRSRLQVGAERILDKPEQLCARHAGTRDDMHRRRRNRRLAVREHFDRQEISRRARCPPGFKCRPLQSESMRLSVYRIRHAGRSQLSCRLSTYAPALPFGRLHAWIDGVSTSKPQIRSRFESLFTRSAWNEPTCELTELFSKNDEFSPSSAWSHCSDMRHFGKIVKLHVTSQFVCGLKWNNRDILEHSQKRCPGERDRRGTRCRPPHVFSEISSTEGVGLSTVSQTGSGVRCEPPSASCRTVRPVESRAKMAASWPPIVGSSSCRNRT